jgi:hypothetical protein
MLLGLARRQAAGLATEFRTIIDRTRLEGIVWPPLTIRSLELDPTDLPVHRMTLLVDVAHCMAPCEFTFPCSYKAARVVC